MSRYIFRTITFGDKIAFVAERSKSNKALSKKSPNRRYKVLTHDHTVNNKSEVWQKIYTVYIALVKNTSKAWQKLYTASIALYKRQNNGLNDEKRSNSVNLMGLDARKS